MSKILANQIANYGDDAPIEIKEGLNIPAGKPIQAAGSAGSAVKFLVRLVRLLHGLQLLTEIIIVFLINLLSLQHKSILIGMQLVVLELF